MQEDLLKKARILIVDDQESNVRLLERLLQQWGYANLKSTTDPRQATALYDYWQPDLINLDLHMPYLDGFGVMEQLRPRIGEGDYVPILVLTADITPETKRRALSSGAKDFLTKPFDPIEVLLRVQNLLETRFLHVQLQKQNELLEDRVRERTQQLVEAEIEVLERLALAAEYRDDDTHQHTQRVGDLASRLAQALGLPETQVELMRRAAPLHDMGKIGISDLILLKPERLTPEEFERMKAHTTIGGRILSGSRFPLLQMAEEIATTHHERWDGRGYAGRKGEDIPMSSRIVTVADVFDALTHARPYKKAWPREQAVREIEQQEGQQFAPRVVEAFLHVIANSSEQPFR